MRNKIGFTLAEVLITLVIVGVIAAITVPVLMQKKQNEETVAKLKKAYSTLAQATNQIIAEEGPVITWVTSTDDVYNLYKKKLRNAKECDKNTGCLEQGGYKYLNGGKSSNWNTNNNYRRLILADGVQVNFEAVNSACNSNAEGSKNVCILIDVDLNGEKKPNAVARDLFTFGLKKTGLYPSGCDNIELCNKTQSGYACACKVLRENAINY